MQDYLRRLETLPGEPESVSDATAKVADALIDLAEALEQKLVKDAAKYPVEKARGRNVKYDEL